MKVEILSAAIIFLVDFTTANPAPATFAKQIRKKWDNNGVQYPHVESILYKPNQQQQTEKPPDIGHVDEVVPVHLKQSLIKWGKTGARKGHTKSGQGWINNDNPDIHAIFKATPKRQRSKRQRTTASMLTKKAISDRRKQVVDSEEESLSIANHDTDSDWSMSREIEESSGGNAGQSYSRGSSEESVIDSESQENPNAHSDERDLTEMGTLTSTDYDSEEDSTSGKTGRKRKTSTSSAYVGATKQKSRKLFEEIWKKNSLSLDLEPELLAQRVLNAKVEGMNTYLFRRLANIYTKYNAKSDYRKRYEFRSYRGRMEAINRIKYPIPKPKPKKGPTIRKSVGDPYGNNARDAKRRARIDVVEKALIEYLTARKLNYKQMTISQLEQATRDFTVLRIPPRTQTACITQIVQKWKNATRVDMHQFLLSRKRSKDRSYKAKRL